MDKNKYKETKDDLTNNVEDDNDLEITKSKDSINKLKKIKEEEKSKNKEVDLDKEKINKLEEDLVSAKDEKLRLLAEMENLRKRLEKEEDEGLMGQFRTTPEIHYGLRGGKYRLTNKGRKSYDIK